MKKLTLIFLLVFTVLSLKAWALGYSSVIKDLPLMPNMVEDVENSLIFDKPNGRIMESLDSVAASKREVETFYVASLPPLGWKYNGSLAFSREGEVLRIYIDDKTDKSGKILVKFVITPSGV